MGLQETFLEWNKQLFDPSVHIDTKREILNKLRNQVTTAENITLAIKSGLFFGLAALAKNVKADEETLTQMLSIMCNLTACDTEGYTILINEGCQNLIIEFADKTLSDRMCEAAIWCIANLAVESAEATKIIVSTGCYDRVLDIYLSKADTTKHILLHSTTAWCLACLFLHKALDEENKIKALPALKILLEKEPDDESLRYLRFIIVDLIVNDSRKIVEEAEKNNIFKAIQEGFLKNHSKSSQAFQLYLEMFEIFVEDKDTRDITLKYITNVDVSNVLIKQFLENNKGSTLVIELMKVSGDFRKRFHEYPESYKQLYQRIEFNQTMISPYWRVLRELISRGNKEVLEAIMKVEHSHKTGFLQFIIRAIPVQAMSYDVLIQFLEGLTELVTLSKDQMADKSIPERVRAVLNEKRNFVNVKNFLDKQKDEDLQAAIKKLYEAISLKTEEKNEKDTKKVQFNSDSKLKENLPLKDEKEEEISNSLKRKFKRMSTMAQTALNAQEFLKSAGENLRKTRNQTKKAAEEERVTEEEVKKSSKKKVQRKGEKKLDKALPEHPAIRRTKTIEETIAAAKAFIKGNEKGQSVRRSLRSATKAAKRLRRTRTIAETIQSNKGLIKDYGKGKRVKEEVDYSHLFFKRPKKLEP